MANTLRHFDLAPVQYVDAALINPNDELDSFVLSLAHSFNEMKLFFWAHENLAESEEGTPLTPYFGQRAGMLQQVERMVHACAYEVWGLVQHASSNGILAKPLLKKAVAMLSKPHKKAWAKLVKSAASASDARNVLDEVRNHLSFHYKFKKVLAEGYEKHFVSDAKSKFNEKAMFSLGKNMEGCRFYFADAAAAGAVAKAVAKTKTPGSQPFGETMKEILETMNGPIVHLVAAYLGVKLKETRANVP